MFLPAKTIFSVLGFALLAESVCYTCSFSWKIFISLHLSRSAYIFGHLILAYSQEITRHTFDTFSF